MSPQRVQRTRKKGQPGMPPGAIYVGRPSRFGNPWANFRNRALAVVLYEDMANGYWNPSRLLGYSDDEVHRIYSERLDWLWQLGRGHPAEIIRAELAGHDLACWCPLVDEFGQPVDCHADVLLRVANGGGAS